MLLYVVLCSVLISPHGSPLTNVVLFGPVCRDLVVHFLVVKEVEGLEGVEDEVTQILVHVDSQDPPVVAVDGAASVHHLRAGTAPPWVSLPLHLRAGTAPPLG